LRVIRELIARHKGGELIGIMSICSAHPLVIRAALNHALKHDAPFLLLEATSNQVNQEGGYTAMTPLDFRHFVCSIANEVGYPAERLVLGGDHLGPNPWTKLPAEQAMAKAEMMVAQYVAAGFSKIHLDCSMSCSDDPAPLPERTIAERAARLCEVAEASYHGEPDDGPSYVIGTEVPVPGGAAEDLDTLAVTTADAALNTIDMHRDLFAKMGLSEAWRRVIAAVVQPGVEFDHDTVVDYEPAKAIALSSSIEGVDKIVFEAHSTDYQSPEALAALVRDHFAILKVGPGLTFALREALWALDSIEREILPADRRANLRQVALERMREEPAHWSKYYHGDGDSLGLQLQYSLSDRIRYYWPDKKIAKSQEQLFANLRETPPPLALVSQYLPIAFAAHRAGNITLDPAELVIAHVCATLDAYYGACNFNV
jgi:D-tagatose-1,6-bisphosphate aldolase subunit GatZ/KbaZ